MQLERICAALGIEICELTPDCVNTAFYVHTDGTDGIFLSPALKGKDRGLCLAHEIGHAMLGAYSRNTSQEGRAKIEVKADIFAAVLLAVLALEQKP